MAKDTFLIVSLKLEVVFEQEIDHYFYIFIYVNVSIGFSKCYKDEQNARDTAPLSSMAIKS